jgi:hypothetical protein
MSVKLHAPRLPLLAVAPLAAALLAAADYEALPTFKASALLPANRVKGPLFTVEDAVKNDGFLNQFQIQSTFGAFAAQGRTMLLVREQEIAALGELDKVSKSEVFLKSAGNSVLQVGKGVGKAVTDPGDTVKGVGAGIKRFGVNLGRKTKRAADSATDDEKKEGDDKSTGDKTAEAAEGAAYDILGVTGAQRRWAQKLNVDPYSSNRVLRKALQDIGKIDSAGGIAAKVAVPVPMVVSTTATVSNLVWGKDPEELRKLLEGQVAALGVKKEDSEAFFKNKYMTPTHWVRIVTALTAVKAKGSADYVDTAATVKSEREAMFLAESASMLQQLHAQSPVESILTDTRVMIARTKDGRAIALLPADHIPWTERLDKGSRDLAERSRQELGATSLEIWLPGTVSPRAQQELKAVGWSVREKTFAK